MSHRRTDASHPACLTTASFHLQFPSAHQLRWKRLSIVFFTLAALSGFESPLFFKEKIKRTSLRISFQFLAKPDGLDAGSKKPDFNRVCGHSQKQRFLFWLFTVPIRTPDYFHNFSALKSLLNRHLNLNYGCSKWDVC